MKKLLIVACLLLTATTAVRAINNVNVAGGGNISSAVNGNSVGTSGTCTSADGKHSESGVGLCIHVAAGTSNGPFTPFLNNGAGPTTRIMIVSDTDKAAKWFTSNVDIRSPYITIAGFEIYSDTSNYSYAMAIEDADSLNVHDIHVLGNYVHDFMRAPNNCPPVGAIYFGGVGNTHDNWVIGNVIRAIGNPSAHPCNDNHGIYDEGIHDIIENNIISGTAGWGIQVRATAFKGIISNNTFFDDNGGIVLDETQNSGAGPTGVIDYFAINNNIVILSTASGTGSAGIYGINWYHVSGTHGVANNNLIYSNLPNDQAHHGSKCGSDASGSTPVVGIPISGTDGDGNAGGCPQTNPKTDSGGATATFVNFVADTNASPTGSYNYLNYKLKAGSNAIQGGVSGPCAASGTNQGLSPCVPSVDIQGTARPSSGVQDIGAFVSSSAGVPIVSFNPSPVGFGTIAVSTTATATLTLTNSGAANLTFTAASLSGTNAADFKIVSTTCSSPLSAAASCTYSLSATPSASGLRSANLTLNDNAAGSPHQVPLTVTGGSVAITMTPSTLAFGVVAPSAGGTSCGSVGFFTINSAGTSNLVLGLGTISDTVDYNFAGQGSCTNGQSLAPGASCTVSIKFCPTTAGSKPSTLSYASNAPTSPTVVSMTGTGGAPVVSLSPSSGSCGSQQVGTSLTCQAFTLTNTGNLSLTGVAISITGANPTSYSQSNNCPATVASSGSCTITVFFNPVAAGTLTANLSVVSSATSSPNLAALTGTGTVPTTVTLAPQSVNFNQVLKNTTSTSIPVSLTNTGAGAVTITSITTASPFAQTNNCPISPATLAAGLSCTINVTATPTALGTVNGALTVVDNATGSPHVASLSVTGVIPGSTLSPSTLAFGNQTVGSPSSPLPMTISSTGTAPLSGTGQVVLNVDELQPGWKAVCILPSCNPGGSGIPTATSQTFNNASPSKDGKSMLVSLSGPANTNALWTYIAGALDQTTNIVSDFWVQPGATAAAQYEFDDFVFSSSTGKEFMWGSQCNKVTNKWQVFNQLTLAWVDVSGSTCSLASGSFHHIVKTVHRISTDTNSCSGQPCMYYDSIVVDGSAIPGLPMTEPAGPLPNGWVSAVGWQVQLNIASGGSPVFENIDLANFTFSSLVITGTNAADFTQTNACGLSIPVNSSCGLNVVFNPGGAGSRTATITYASNDPSSPNTASLTGTGIATAPAVCVNPSSLNFGNQPVSSTSGALPVTITNCGTANLVVSGVTPTGNFAETNTCGTVTPGATCVISGTFSPLSAGALTGQFSMASNAATSPTIIPLSGFGTQTGATLTPSSINFGSTTVGTPAANRLLTVANTGNVSLSVLAPVMSGANPGDFVPGSCPPTLAPNAQCTYFTTFNPSGAGSRSATLTQPFGNGVTSVTSAFSGTGVATAPAVTTNPSSLDFGNVTTGVLSSVKTVQIQNSGTSLLTFSSIALTGTNSADYTLVSHCGATLAAGSICTADLSVTPGGTGARTASLTLTDDAADSPQNVTMTVNGVAAPAPRVSLSTTTLTFSPPSIQTGTTSGALSVTATNIGNANLTVSHPVILGGSNPGDFTVSDNCGTVLPGASCTAVVNCIPTAAGSRTATVPFVSNASSSPDTATASCTGFVGTPTLIIAATNINFGNQTVGTTSSPAVFTISNTGTASATGVVITASGDFTVSDNCSGAVSVGGSCSASVRFNPQVLCGQTDPNNPSQCISNIHLGTVKVVSNTSNSPQTVTLEGTAIPVTPPSGPITVTMQGQVVVSGNVSIH